MPLEKMGMWCENSSKPLQNQSKLTYFYKNFTGGEENWSILIISIILPYRQRPQIFLSFPFLSFPLKQSYSFNLFLVINMMFLLLFVVINIKCDRKYMLFLQVYLHFKIFSEGQMTPKLLCVKLVIIG